MLYLDDVTLGGDREEVLHDFKIFEREAADLGLLLNQHKSEVICEARSTREYILSSIPGASVIASSDACLLGSPVGDIDSVSMQLHHREDLPSGGHGRETSTPRRPYCHSPTSPFFYHPKAPVHP